MSIFTWIVLGIVAVAILWRVGYQIYLKWWSNKHGGFG